MSWLPCSPAWVVKTDANCTSSWIRSLLFQLTMADPVKVMQVTIVIERIFCLLLLARYITTLNRYFTTSSEKITIAKMDGIPGNHSNFVFCHNSLNSVNVIQEKSNCSR